MAAAASGHSLSDKDASIVLGMFARGDRAHDISAFFGVNPARVFEVRDGGGRWAGSINAAPTHELPPAGAPGVKGRHLRDAVRKAVAMLDDGDAVRAKAALSAAAKQYDANEG